MKETIDNRKLMQMKLNKEGMVLHWQTAELGSLGHMIQVLNTRVK